MIPPSQHKSVVSFLWYQIGAILCKIPEGCVHHEEVSALFCLETILKYKGPGLCDCC